MLQEQLKTLRKQKGWSQEELANQLHVTRQTISKWEQGISVPDADVLVQLSEIFNISVEELIQKKTSKTADVHELTQQMKYLNEGMRAKERRNSRIWHMIKLCLISMLALALISLMISVVSLLLYGESTQVTIETIEP